MYVPSVSLHSAELTDVTSQSIVTSPYIKHIAQWQI
jgi:hypothetical protein